MLTITTTLAAFAAFATPSLAAPGDLSFEHDGQTYVYHVEDKGAVKLISGKTYPSGESFTFAVRGNRVNGTIGARQVAFGLNEVERGIAKEIKVADR
jgi:hypothetical protein